MTTLRRALPGNRTLSRFGSDFLPSSLGETLGAVVGDPTLRPSQLLARQAEIEAEQGREVFDPFQLGQPITEEDRPKDLVAPEKLNEEFGHLGLKFDRPESRKAAEIIARNKREEMIRQDIIARGPRGVGPTILQFGAALAGSVIDPLNVAAGFFPAPGAARLAGVAVQATRTGRAALTIGQRARLGFVEGAAGNLLIEPVVGALATEQQLDYGLSDAFLNVALGGLIGSGVHAVRGVVPRVAERLRPETRNAAIRASVVQMAEGRSVEVDPVIREGLLSSTSLSTRRRQDVDVGRAVDITPRAVEDRRAVDATLVPSVTRSGKVRAFATREQAEAAALDIRADVAVQEAGDGRFFLAAAAEHVVPLRRPTGEVQRFRTQREAEKFLTRTGRDKAEHTILRQGVAEDRGFVILRGGDERTRQRLTADPDLVRFTEVERRPFEPGPREGPPPEGRQAFAAEITRRESSPLRDTAADFGASEHASQAAETTLSQPDPETSVGEVEFVQRQIDELRASGVIGEAVDKELEAVEQMMQRAEATSRSIRAAATCLLR